jgi:uncharacterized protein related to proFAR isomerase
MKEIQYNKEDITDEELLEMIEDKDRMHDLKVVLDMKGGRMLRDALLDEVLNNLQKLANNYDTLSQTEFIAIGASLATRLDLLNTLNKASENLKTVKEDIQERLRQ